MKPHTELSRAMWLNLRVKSPSIGVQTSNEPILSYTILYTIYYILYTIYYAILCYTSGEDRTVGVFSKCDQTSTKGGLERKEDQKFWVAP